MGVKFLRSAGQNRIRMSHLIFTALAILQIAIATSALAQDGQDDWFAKGKEIYADQCATCHGDQGEGVEGAYNSPLQGDLSKKRLLEYIDKTMPEDDPESCIGPDADLVTRYIMQAFYTPEAQLRNNPPAVAFSRLTANQYKNALADLMNIFLGRTIPDPQQHGLDAIYYKSRSIGKDKIEQRTDPAIDFDWKQNTPFDEKIKDKEQFSIQWTGTIVAPESGKYEFTLVTKNGASLYVNTGMWKGTPIIDNMTASGESEHHGSVELSAGRPYPIGIKFFKYKDKQASIRLDWKTPSKPRQRVPADALYKQWSPAICEIRTRFPADDSSFGYQRGTSISRQWDQATTRSAVELLEFVQQNFDDLTGFNNEIRKKQKTFSDDQKAQAERTRVRHFCGTFVYRAFRRGLTAGEQKRFIDDCFVDEPDIKAAMQRCILRTLKSPQFLYVIHRRKTSADVKLAVENEDHYSAVEKMALGFWDSIPDKRLLAASKEGWITQEKNLHDEAWRMVDDPRTKIKLRKFFHHWLELDRAAQAAKDPTAFPGFDKQLLASLSESLEKTIDNIVWSKDSDYRKLLRSNEIFIDNRIAEFYQLEKPQSDDFEKLPFEPDHRAGVLTHPYLMSGFSYYKTTSPIHRGVFVAKSLLGRSLKPPPFDVEPLAEDFDPTMTTRQRVAHQTKEVNCQGCHSVINPLGFSFENFDAVGRFRQQEKDQAIDASAEYETPAGEIVKFGGAQDLATFLVDNQDAHQNFIEQLFQHFAKQPLAAYGTDKPEYLTKRFRELDFNIKALLVEMSILVAQHELVEFKK